MNKSQRIRQHIMDNPNRVFSARDIERELGITGTHVSNELGACMPNNKRGKYLTLRGYRLRIIGKGEYGAYNYVVESISKSKTVEPTNEYIVTTNIKLSDIPNDIFAKEVARRLKVTQ